MTNDRRDDRLVSRIARFVREAARRYVEVGAIERGVALGAQAFTALLPLFMLYSVLVPRREGRGFVESMIERFGLEGASADALRAAFEPPAALTDDRASTSTFGAVLLMIAALSFTRTMQRLYERCYGLPQRGFKGTGWGLLWLGLLSVPLVLRGILTNQLSGEVLITGILILNFGIWTLTPVVLSSRRLRFRHVAPGAALTAIAMTVLSTASALWLPHSVAVSAADYGLIGVAFALVSWLVGAGITLSVATVIGSAFTDEFGRGPRRPRVREVEVVDELAEATS